MTVLDELLTIFNVASLEEVDIEGVNLFAGLNGGQVQYLEKILRNLQRSGVFEPVVNTVVRLFAELGDVTFPNFLSLSEFAAVYIMDEVDRENLSRLREGSPFSRDSLIQYVVSKDSFMEDILTAFNDVKDEIERERSLSPNFRNTTCAVYHFYKHRRLPNGHVLTVPEYYFWIRYVLDKVKTLSEYRSLVERSRRDLKYEVYIQQFERRMRIILKNFFGQMVLASAFVVDAPFHGDQEGDEWIDGRPK